MTTSELLHPCWVGEGVTVVVTRGGVRSTLPTILTVAVLPALSVAEPTTAWPSPSLSTMIGAEHVAMPNSSLHSNLTPTGTELHPLAFISGETMARTTGGLLSTTTI